MNELIDLKKAQPLYLQVVEAIRGRINRNFWHLGMMIPSENQLALEFKVSPGTVKKALSVLVQDGVLFRRQGKGTFVAGPDFSNSFIRFFRYDAQGDGEPGMPGSRILDICVIAPEARAAQSLRLTSKDRVIRVERVRTLAGEPIVWERIFLPYKVFKGFEILDIEDRLLYPIYNEEFSTPIIWADEYLQPDKADAYTAGRLGIRPDDPVIRVERIAYTYGDTPVECRFGLGRGDQFRYHITVR